MNKSEQINELATALAKAQGAVRPAIKDSTNPHFKSRYADLAAVWDACREALSAHGLSVAQLVVDADQGIGVETVLMHASGQWLSSTFSMPVSKNDAQGVGSAVTYARRYALAAMVGVAPEDDDGNAAVASRSKPEPRRLAQVLDEHRPPSEDEVRTADRILELDAIANHDDLESWCEMRGEWYRLLEGMERDAVRSALVRAATRCHVKPATVKSWIEPQKETA